ncbi:GH25 family lysozyme [Apilactobacillus quenuiae]|uniref:GH25 family lysozyme n=1 Tax=Apilactobacillus quenuiae TaxID=2008377 RepID=UPI000D01E4D8|nr:GH25 family lysozyme [Apilactobacillus quenuiae]
MEYFADVSNYQWTSDYDHYVNFLKSAKSKYKIKSTCILLSDGDSWTNPVMKSQVSSSYKLFGSFSCYHFFRGSVEAEVNNFLNALKQVGADKSTVLMIDAEVRLANLTNKLNEFIKALNEYGYKNIYVYSMGSMLDYANNGIQTGKLKNAKVWIASYGSIKPGGADAWQFTSTANANGISFDLNQDYVGELANGVKEEKPAKKKPTYWQQGELFEADSMLNVYHDLDFKTKREPRFAPKSRFYAKVVKHGKITRLQTHLGYVSANTDFSEKIK